MAAPCLSPTSTCTEQVDIGSGKMFQIQRTYSLMGIHPNVKRAVIVVHGTSQNPGSYFSYIINNTEALGLSTESMVIAPFFKELENNPGTNDLYWSTGWRSGNLSQNSGPRYSSFDVGDFLLLQLKDKTRFPNLKQITVVGHSAGGQYLQRFALGTQIPNDMPEYQFSFVVANPSSYAYLDNRRRIDTSTTDFGVPSTSCSTYNNWAYGLDALNSYMSRVSVSQLIAQYLPRKVTYLSGGADTVRDTNLVVTCEADLQGLNRNERERTYANHIETFYPNNNHRYLEVPNVGHSASGMFGSSQGRSVIFPTIAVTDPNPETDPDVTPPTVKIVSPGSYNVKRSFTLSVTATDNVGVAKLTCLLDGQVMKTVYNTNSISCALSVSRGEHMVSSQATDAAGNTFRVDKQFKAK